jgi:hypothetical protein
VAGEAAAKGAGIVKTIQLTRGQVAVVDDEDWPLLSSFKWQAHRGPHDSTWYAVRASRVGGKKTKVRMHRIILEADASLQVDHRNGDGLDNRRSNLRISTPSQNQQHRIRPTRPQKSSQWKGVYWCSQWKRWRARILVAGERLHLGTYRVEVDAARAYDRAALEHFGAFAAPNFPGSESPNG